MNIIKQVAMQSHLTEGQVYEIADRYVTGRVTKQLLESAIERVEAKNTRKRQQRALNESFEDAKDLVGIIQDLATSTFLTESQIVAVIDKNPNLDYMSLTESKILQLIAQDLGIKTLNESAYRKGLRAAKELNESSDIRKVFHKRLNESKKFKNSLVESRKFKNSLVEGVVSGDIATVPAIPAVATDPNVTSMQGDINAIPFGVGQDIRLPVGYSHIAVDYDGSVNAYTSEPIYGKKGWEGEGPLRVGRVTWDPNKFGGANDPRTVHQNKHGIAASQLYAIHDQLNLRQSFEDCGAFCDWKALLDDSPADSINESEIVSSSNRFLAIPSHML